MSSSLFAQLESIKTALTGEKPGKLSHFKMAAIDKDRFDKYYNPSADAHQAAVLLLITQRKDQSQIIFMRRAHHKDDKHSGQISFPGGRREETDKGYLDCALRETHEEIGVSSEHIEVLGKLSPLYVVASNHLVQPYVGYFKNYEDILPNDEVAEILFGTMESFLTDRVSKTTINTHGTVLRDVPYYDLDGHVLWGATAMILTEFLAITRDIII